MTRTKKKHPGLRPRQGMLPGEYRRQATVTIMRPVTDRDRVGAAEFEEPHRYIAATKRLDRVFTHEIEYRGQLWAIPGEVMKRLMDQRESIIKEDRRRRAQDRQGALSAVAERDQAEAEAEESRPAGV